VPAVSMAEEVERTKPRHSSLAVAVAILLAIPASSGGLPWVGLGPIAAAIDASIPQQGDLAKPTSQVRPAQPRDLSVLARWSWLETKPSLPETIPQVRPAAVGEAPTTSEATHAPHGNPKGVINLSSIGTARRPTGPPSASA
jgi:hypothetical protein